MRTVHVFVVEEDLIFEICLVILIIFVAYANIFFSTDISAKVIVKDLILISVARGLCFFARRPLLLFIMLIWVKWSY